MMLRRNVLIFHEAALGDFVLTWPIALAAARISPQSRIIYVTASQKGALAEAVLRVECTNVEAGWHRLFQPDVGMDQLDANVRRMLAGTHTAIVFAPTSVDSLSENLKRLSLELRVVTLSTELDASRHFAENLIDRTEWKPLAEAARQILGGIRNRGLAFNRSPSVDVLIHPGSGGAAKRWPVERFVALADRLKALNKTCNFVIGEVEREKFTDADIAALHSVTAVLEPATYVDLLKQISTARAYVGNDSGPTHLAAMLGIKTTAIFGPTDPLVWSPIGPDVTILRGEPTDSVTIDTVLATL